MPSYIIYKDGVYNVFSTVSDAPRFSRGLTLDELTEYTREESGNAGLRELPARLERAHSTGCSAIDTMTLEECIGFNRAGPGESCVPVEDFIARYLTRPTPEAKERTP